VENCNSPVINSKLSKGCTVNINEYWTYIAFKANVAVINNSPTNLEKEQF